MTRKRVAREAGVFLFFLVLSIALTWPLARDISHFVSDLGDPLLNAWIIDWDCYALTHAPLKLYDAPIYVPGRLPLAYSENEVGIAILILPFWLLGLPPLAVLNVAMLISFALSGYGAYVLARTCRTSFLAAIAAGVLFAFCPFKFDHLPHLQIIASGWLPLTLAALLAYWRSPGRGRAALLAAAFVMNGLSNIHYLLFGGVAVVLTIALLASIDRGHDRRFWAALTIALVVAGAVLLPFLIPYQIVSKTYGMHRGVGETSMGSAVPMDWLVASGRSRWYGRIADPSTTHAERQLFPGLAPLFLAAFAFFLRRRTTAIVEDEPNVLSARHRSALRALDVTIVVCAFLSYFGIVMERVEWKIGGMRVLSFSTAGLPMTILVAALIARLWIRIPRALLRRDTSLARILRTSRFTPAELSAALWIVIGVMGSFGLNLFFHQFLYRWVTIFQSIRAPSRWAVIAYVGLAVWSALGIDEIAARLKTNSRQLAAASGLVVLAIVDMLPIMRWERAVTVPAPAYVWLKQNHIRGPLLELPLSGGDVQYLYMLMQPFHRVPIMNGLSGFEPPVHARLRDDFETYKPDATDMALIEKSGARFILLHADWLRFQRDPTFKWLRAQLAAGHIAFVRRFDHGQNGDWLFAVTANAPDWRQFRAADVPDRAGFSPAQNLQRFFSAQPTFNSSTFAYVDLPKAWSEVRGPLQVLGWAMSPNDIARVVVHFDSNRRQFDAQLSPRPDIGRVFNDWYPSGRAGFAFTLPKRPKGVAAHTDVQIEVIDGSNASTWLQDLPMWWY